MKRRLSMTLLLVASLLVALPALAESPVDKLAEANAAYEAGRYEQARQGYRALVDADLHNEILYYNLGCANARLGRYGEAILAFRRALRYAPGHEDARANLEWVRSRAGEEIPAGTGVRALMERAAALVHLQPGCLPGDQQPRAGGEPHHRARRVLRFCCREAVGAEPACFEPGGEIGEPVGHGWELMSGRPLRQRGVRNFDGHRNNTRIRRMFR